MKAMASKPHLLVLMCASSVFTVAVEGSVQGVLHFGAGQQIPTVHDPDLRMALTPKHISQWGGQVLLPWNEDVLEPTKNIPGQETPGKSNASSTHLKETRRMCVLRKALIGQVHEPCRLVTLINTCSQHVILAVICLSTGMQIYLWRLSGPGPSLVGSGKVSSIGPHAAMSWLEPLPHVVGHHGQPEGLTCVEL